MTYDLVKETAAAKVYLSKYMKRPLECFGNLKAREQETNRVCSLLMTKTNGLRSTSPSLSIISFMSATRKTNENEFSDVKDLEDISSESEEDVEMEDGIPGVPSTVQEALCKAGMFSGVGAEKFLDLVGGKYNFIYLLYAMFNFVSLLSL